MSGYRFDVQIQIEVNGGTACGQRTKRTIKYVKDDDPFAIAGGLPMRQPCSPKPGSEGMQVHAPGVQRTPKACFCNRLP
ncbi:MAG TPA: hypothetical protein VK775_18315, partial [Chthoniobacterales bacterium]|nr:hypothetical protein [Chthoniobacterales bacterium]